MAGLIDRFYNALFGVGLLGLVACSTPRYAHQDYGQVPAAQGGTPFHRLQQIAADVCDKASVTENELRCTTTRSILENIFPAECPNGYSLISNSWGYQSCRREMRVPWDRVLKVIPGSSIVDICFDDKTCLRMERFDDAQQARNFARAINDYLQ